MNYAEGLHFSDFHFLFILVVPSSYFFPAAAMSVNGSSATGNCSNTMSIVNDNGPSKCDAPDSSVLFDGNIPTLTGLDGDMWASQLLTLQTSNVARREITFDFTELGPSHSGGQQFRILDSIQPHHSKRLSHWFRHSLYPASLLVTP